MNTAEDFIQAAWMKGWSKKAVWGSDGIVSLLKN